MTTRDDDFNPRPGRIHHGNQGAKRPKSFVGEVMRAAKKAGHRGQTFRRSSGLRRPFDLRPRAAGGAVPGLPIVRPARRRHGPDRAPPWRSISFRAALEASRLPEARRSDPRRRRRPDVRRSLRRRRHEGFRRTVRRGPASFPVHSLSRGRGPARRPSGLHARAHEGRGARPRNGARLGRSGSLEHRQPPYPRARPRPRRRRPGLGHKPRLHQQGLSRPCGRTGHAGNGAAQRAGNPRGTGERGRGGTLDQSRPIAPRHLRRGWRHRRPTSGRRQRRSRTTPVDARPCRQARAPRFGRTSRLGAVDLEARPRAGPARSRHPGRHHQDDAPGDERGRNASPTSPASRFTATSPQSPSWDAWSSAACTTS